MSFMEDDLHAARQEIHKLEDELKAVTIDRTRALEAMTAQRDELVRALRAQAGAMCCLDGTIALLDKYKDVT